MTAQIEFGNLPLTEATLFILLSLAPGSKHGYAIMKDVQTLSDHRVILSTGTLYGALRRLLGQAWIERVDDLTNETDRERKAYALTHLGRRILKAETARLQKLASLAQLRVQKKQAGT